MGDAAQEVAALEQQVASSAAAAQDAETAAIIAVAAAAELTENVQQAAQEAAAAVVETVIETKRDTEWNTERMEQLARDQTTMQATLTTILVGLETLTAAVALLNPTSAASQEPAPVTQSPSSANADGLPVAESLPVAQPVEAEPKPQPVKAKRFHLMR